MRRERLFLQDIVLAADAIAEFTRGQDLDSFEADRMLRSAVVHQLTIIGEAAAKVPAEVQRRHPDLPWATMRGIRNRLVHGYFAVDMSILVATARLDLPPLIPRLRHLVAAEAGQPDEPGRRSGP